VPCIAASFGRDHAQSLKTTISDLSKPAAHLNKAPSVGGSFDQRSYGANADPHRSYIPLVAFFLRHFLAGFIISMREFDFRQAQVEISAATLRRERKLRSP
jgi:hypothetical protein